MKVLDILSIRGLLLFCLFSLCSLQLIAQERPNTAQFDSPNTLLWLGNYGKFRLSDKLFWDAQFHYRTTDFEGTPYIGRLTQIYNRHAINYLITPNFSASLGGVLRLNFSQNPGDPNFEKLRLEPRIWHEYLFSMPFPRYIMYHRIRIEHRWSQGNHVDAEWVYRDRWRYKFYMAIPLNKPKLQPGAFFFTPDVEIIMQSGRRVVDSPLEDLRFNPTIGYIANPRFKYTAGMMYTTGQKLNAGYEYNTRWVMRLNVYISLDFRKFEEKIPEIYIYD